MITPTGRLDPASVGRLRQVVESRAGGHDDFVVDSRSVATVTEAGLEALVLWLGEPSGDARAPRLVAGVDVSEMLAGSHGPLLLDAAEIS